MSSGTNPSSGGGAPTGAAGGELGGTYPNPTVAATHSGSAHHTAFVQADHDALANPHHSNATDHTRAHAQDGASDHSAGTLGDTLHAAAAGAWTRLTGNITTTRKFFRQTGDGAASAAPAWDTIADADIPATHAGGTHHSNANDHVNSEAAHSWHAAHAAFATNAIVLGTAAAAGAATTTLRSNDTILAFDVTVPVTQASADAAATGAAAVAARRDHRHGMPTIPAAASGGTPAVVLGTAAAAGAAATFLRTDDTIVGFDVTVPVTQAYSDAAATGTAAVAARRDHKHGMPAAGAGSDISTTALRPAGSPTIATNLSAVAVRSYTIASAQKLTVGSAARFRIL